MKTVEFAIIEKLEANIKALQKENSKLKKSLEKYKDLENQVVTKLGRNNIYNIKLIKNKKAITPKHTVNYKEVDIETLEVSGIDTNDHPKYCDAYFSSGKDIKGNELSDYDLDLLSDKYPELVNDLVHSNIKL